MRMTIGEDENQRRQLGYEGFKKSKPIRFEAEIYKIQYEVCVYSSTKESIYTRGIE